MEDGHRQVSIELRYVGCGERAVQRGRLQQYRRTTFGGTIFYADLLTCGAVVRLRAPASMEFDSQEVR